ncbi:peroxiredoxin [Nitriliruptoraceae bacterium ZYF776]|nr:peroxiredoxin [Profundirhabdus halotolerans]
MPDLPLRLHDGRSSSLAALASDGPLVVFFYPKAFTGGCTAQACHFRDLGAEFAELGASRLGVSRDDGDTQARFADEHGFDYPLATDRDGAIARAFGAKRPGPMWSKRQTSVVDTDLTLLATIRSETDMTKHADEALAVLRSRVGR